MWESIFDAWACWSGWNFGPNSSEYPYSVVQNTPLPPKWKLSIPPPQWKLSESPNPRVSEYPPKMKIVRESRSESFRILPPNENCQRVQIREFQNTPQNENCQRVQSESFRIPPNENCQRVQIWEFQNTPLIDKLSDSPNPRVSEYPSQMKIVRESKSESFRIPPPPKLEKLQISNFRIVLQPGRSYVETNL